MESCKSCQTCPSRLAAFTGRDALSSRPGRGVWRCLTPPRGRVAFHRVDALHSACPAHQLTDVRVVSTSGPLGAVLRDDRSAGFCVDRRSQCAARRLPLAAPLTRCSDGQSGDQGQPQISSPFFWGIRSPPCSPTDRLRILLERTHILELAQTLPRAVLWDCSQVSQPVGGASASSLGKGGGRGRLVLHAAPSTL